MRYFYILFCLFVLNYVSEIRYGFYTYTAYHSVLSSHMCLVASILDSVDLSPGVGLSLGPHDSLCRETCKSHLTINRILPLPAVLASCSCFLGTLRHSPLVQGHGTTKRYQKLLPFPGIAQ